MTFKVNYKKDTGIIDSYQGGDDDSENACPEDCSTLEFESVFPGFFDANNMPAVKVDLDTLELVLLNPNVIPKAINK